MRPDLTAQIQVLQPSLIRELANEADASAKFSDLIQLWYGEPDLPTAEVVRRACQRALDRGETFYTPNAGILSLRQALADYMNGLYGTDFGVERILVTGSGTLALTIAAQALLAPGDDLVTHAPHWPNLSAIQQLRGARVVRVPLELHEGRWRLDLQRLFDACGPGTRAILVNSPANPTGWVLDDDGQREILDFCRRRGIWLVADEVYNRIVYDRPCAPTFADKIGPEDPVLIVNSFSKTWAMTGWRLGWLTIPAGTLGRFEMLTEYTNSCTSAATQLAGVCAIHEGEPCLRESLARWDRSRRLLRETFAQLPRVHCPAADGAFYAWFACEGVTDSYALAGDILHEARVGLAPGVAFGPEGEGWLRLCHAVAPALMERALERLLPVLK
ncbi:MAG: pyridoxal phosphate-dependent aminotransferase [Anaerolineaceae bacterium]|nr:pyridoxal phosphate-dependent aminotransferase [Anaerolineaceae bacterium]MDE0328075.1 pyridoxal phosphate-dependent aminotransferase [Anaerolineaceae bacterium]